MKADAPGGNRLGSIVKGCLITVPVLALQGRAPLVGPLRLRNIKLNFIRNLALLMGVSSRQTRPFRSCSLLPS